MEDKLIEINSEKKGFVERIMKIITSKKSKLILIGIALTVVMVISVFMLGIIVADKREEIKEPEIVTKSALEKIIKRSDISTFEAVYNGVARVMNEKDIAKINYYVAYEAKVKAGFDFEKVIVEMDEENKIITVILPQIEITEVNVDISSMDFMFINEKANEEGATKDAYVRCIEDVEVESGREDAIYELAEKNAVNVMKALINPFLQQLDDTYELVVEFGG